jgi:hypothetical protein
MAAVASAAQQDQVKGEGEEGAHINIQLDALLGGPWT